MQQDEPEPVPQTELKSRGRYRKQLEEAEKTEEAKIPVYSSLVLAVVVLTLGFTAYQNHKKMNEMENTLAQMNQVHIVTEMQETEKKADTGIVVENIAGEVEKTEASATTETSDMQAETKMPETAEIQAGAEKKADTETAEAQAKTEMSETTEAQAKTEMSETTEARAKTEMPETTEAQAKTEMPETTGAQAGTPDETNKNKEDVKETAAQADEAQTYLKQGYYVVQKGDNLAAICRKVYKTTAMMDKVCQANGIDDPDAIYAGQYLTLPN